MTFVMLRADVPGLLLVVARESANRVRFVMVQDVMLRTTPQEHLVTTAALLRQMINVIRFGGSANTKAVRGHRLAAQLVRVS
jgi:hypothetical protein